MKCIHVWVWVAIVNFFFLLGRKSRELLLNDIPTIKMLVLAHINYIVCKLFWTISKPESQRYKCESNFGIKPLLLLLLYLSKQKFDDDSLKICMHEFHIP